MVVKRQEWFGKVLWRKQKHGIVKKIVVIQKVKRNLKVLNRNWNKRQKGLAIYVMFCIIWCIFRIAAGKDCFMDAALYGISSGTEEGVVIGEHTSVDTEFTATVDQIEGFSVFYYDNDQIFTDEKLHFQVYVGDSRIPVRECEMDLALQTDATTVFLTCPLSGIRDKKITVHIDGEGLRGSQGPRLAVTENEVEKSKLSVNGNRKDYVLHFSVSYPVYSRNIPMKVVESIGLILAGFLIFGLCCMGEISTEKRTFRKTNGICKKKACEKKKVTAGVLSGYGVTMLVTLAILEFTYSNTVKESWMKTMFLILAVLILITVSFLYYGCVFRKWNADKLFFAALLLWGTMYAGVLTMYSVPDEPSHIDTAYRISNCMLGIKDSGVSHTLYKRYDDIDPNPTEKTDVSEDSYQQLYEEIFSSCENAKLTETYVRNNLGNAPEICYYAPAFGITVGRLLGMGRLPMLLLGRLCSLLAAALMMYFGVKKLPFGKSIFYVIGLLPITLQEIMSFSYDSFLIGLSYLFAGYFLSWIYGKEKLRIEESIVLLVSLMLLAVAKGGVYMPLVGLVFLYPLRGGSENRKKRMVFCTGVCIMAVLAYVVQNPTILARLGITGSGAGGTGSVSGVQAMYSLSYIIRHPLKMIRVFENTLYEKLDIYLSGILGGRLGWLNIHISWYVLTGFVILLVLAVLAGKRNALLNEKKECVWVLFLCAASVFLVFLSMLVAGTPQGEKIVLGVQGRYFLPVFGIALAAIPTGKGICVKLESQSILFASVMLQVLTVSQILLAVL